MDVKCPKCGTLYDFDDNRVTATGVVVKCTQCGHEFLVKKQEAPLDAAPVENEWHVRTVNGSEFSFRDLTTLQRWIVERKVCRDDQISKTGEVWRRLGDIIELQAFFAAVEGTVAPVSPSPGDAVSQTPAATAPGPGASYPAADPAWAAGSQQAEPAQAFQTQPRAGGSYEVPAPISVPQPVAQPVVQQPEPPQVTQEPVQQQPVVQPDSSAPAEPEAVQPASLTPEQPAVSRPEPQASQSGGGFAGNEMEESAAQMRTDTGEWMAKEPVADEYDDFSDLDEGHVPIGRGKIIAGVVIGLICIIALLFVFIPDTMKSLLGMGGANSEAEAAFETGIKALYKDNYHGFEEARKDFEKAHKADPVWAGALAGMGLVDSAEAEQINDMMVPLRKSLNELKKKMASIPADDEKAKRAAVVEFNDLVRRYKSLQDRIGPIHGRAWKNIEKAQKDEPESMWVRLALADFYRVFGGDQKRKDVADLVGAIIKEHPDNPLVVFERGAFKVTDPRQFKAGLKDLDKALSMQPDMIRASYRKAMAMIAAGDLVKAKKNLKSILGKNPDHEAAQAALKRINALLSKSHAGQEKHFTGKEKSTQPSNNKEENEIKKAQKEGTSSKTTHNVMSTNKEPLKKNRGMQTSKEIRNKEKRSKNIEAGFARMLALGNRYRARGKYEKALDAFEKAADLKPDAPQPHAGMGWAYIDLEAFRAAISEFQKALKVSPRYSDALLGMGESYKFQGNKKMAITYYQKYLKYVSKGEGATIARKYIEDNK
ncbi:MAG: tetratricopeptide repeat protein [Deltaproteobacteria bacterium]|nr:tetratricopeptide repeat protein [Deltaproteobacteria bacterium]